MPPPCLTCRTGCGCRTTDPGCGHYGCRGAASATCTDAPAEDARQRAAFAARRQADALRRLLRRDRFLRRPRPVL